MEREEVVAGRGDEERRPRARLQEAQVGEKLSWGLLSVVKRGGLCTPVGAWKLEENVEKGTVSYSVDESSGGCAPAYPDGARGKRHHRRCISLSFLGAAQCGAGTTVSARELGASLWRIQEARHYAMGRRSGRRSRHREEKLLGGVPNLSARGRQAQVTASDLAIFPARSLEYKGKLENGPKCSTELLRVLNRIWTLEEQHISNRSLIRKLKLELENAHVRIQELVHEKEQNHHEIDGLAKQMIGNKLSRKSKEQERMRATIKSQMVELEEERRLRRHSESLHRRLAKELSEMRCVFSKMSRDLEEEKVAHNLLTDLCDEFAKGIKEYGEEIRALKPLSEKSPIHFNWILEFSGVWLDKRLHTRLAEARGDLPEKGKMVQQLESEVKAFLQARQSYSCGDDVKKDRCLHRHSLESVHLNGEGSAPRYAEDEDSVASDLHSFELTMGANNREARNSSGDINMRKIGSAEKSKVCHGSSSSEARITGQFQPGHDARMQFISRVHGEERKDAGLSRDTFSFPQSKEDETSEDAVRARESTLKAKLLEARLEGQHARLRTSRDHA